MQSAPLLNSSVSLPDHVTTVRFLLGESSSLSIPVETKVLLWDSAFSVFCSESWEGRCVALVPMLALMLTLALSSGGRDEPESRDVWVEACSVFGIDVAVIRLCTVEVGLLSLALAVTVSGDGSVLEGRRLEESSSTEEDVEKRGAAVVVVPSFLLQESQHSLLYPGIEQ